MPLRAEYQHPVLEPAAGILHARGPLRGDCSGDDAGRLAGQQNHPDRGAGTLPTTGPLFTGLLIAAILLIGALTFVPALALGPVAEFLDLLK